MCNLPSGVWYDQLSFQILLHKKESSATSALPSLFLNLYAVRDFFSKRHPLILHPYDQTVPQLTDDLYGLSLLHVMLAQKIADLFDLVKTLFEF